MNDSLTPMHDIEIKDSTEMAKHLRSSHFSLLVVCFVIFAGSFLVDSSRLDRAIYQLEIVTKIQSSWDEDILNQLVKQEGINKKTRNIAKKYWETVDKGLKLSLLSSKKKRITKIELERYSGFVVGPDFIDYPPPHWQDKGEERIIRGNGYHVSLPKPESLNDFKNLWNFLAVQRYFYIFKNLDIEKTILVERKSTAFGDLTYFHGTPIADIDCILEYSSSTEELSKDRLFPFPIGKEEIKQFGIDKNNPSITHYYTLAIWEEPIRKEAFKTIKIPVHTVRSPLNPQDILLGQVDGEFQKGRFNTTFHALNEVTTNISSLNLDQLQGVLKEQKRQLGGGIVLFGAKIPGHSINILSLTILFVMELYLWLQLRAFSVVVATNDVAWNYPWFGFYRDRLSKVVFLFASYVFPAVIALFILFNEFNYWSWPIKVINSIIILLLFITVTLSLNTILNLHDREKLPNE